MKQVVIIGGGISGLSTAHYLQKALGTIRHNVQQITVLDRNSKLGGWFASTRETNSGFLLERGPHSFRPRGENGEYALGLVQDVGLHDQVLGTSGHSTTRYVLTDQHGMQPLPNSLVGMFTSPLTRQLPFVGLRELVHRPAPVENQFGDVDESIHEFFERKFGAFVAENLASAMVSGIYAGDTRQLSLRSCFPILYDMEREHGSIVRAILMDAIRSTQATHASPHLCARLEGDFDKLKSATGVSFRDGMGVLPDAIRRSCESVEQDNGGTPVRFVTGANDIGVDSRGNVSFEVAGERDSIAADHVFSTVPASALLNMLSAVPSERTAPLKTVCDNIGSVDVGVVNLAYKQKPLPRSGFGHLIPSNSQRGVLGVIYDSAVFPAQKPLEGATGESGWLTVMAGGAHFPGIAEYSEQELVDLAIHHVAEHMQICDRPDVAIGLVHRNCIPQYQVGHEMRVQNMEAALKEDMPYLTVSGNHIRGVGITDCIGNAAKNALRYVESIKQGSE